MNGSPLRKRLARHVESPLRVRARQLAFGYGAGSHRASRKGSGIEFAGHRPYSPGDDLRHLDQHALFRHGKLLVREFHTDTERAVHVVIDLSSSMNFRGENHNESKAHRALTLGAALLMAARAGGDAVGLTVIDAEGGETYLPATGQEGFERALARLERAESAVRPLPRNEDLRSEAPSSRGDDERVAESWRKALRLLGSRLRRGSVVFVLSDFLDLGPQLERELVQISSRDRAVRGVQILDQEEIEFPFDGALLLLDPESGTSVETEASAVRSDYLRRLDRHTATLGAAWRAQGGMWLRHCTAEVPTRVFRELTSGRMT